MKKFIAGILGIASVFLASHAFAAGTSSTRFEEIRLLDNVGTWTATNGSTTVTTNLVQVDTCFVQPDGLGSNTVYWVATPSGSTFVIQGWLSGTQGTKYVGTASGYWMAFDR